jgi:hypothetical protein
MSEHAKQAMLDNIEQNLIEIMADFLDSESLKLDEAIGLIKRLIEILKALRQYLVSGRSEQFDCYEIWRPNIPDDGCKTQCKECAEKQKQSNCH